MDQIVSIVTGACLTGGVRPEGGIPDAGQGARFELHLDRCQLPRDGADNAAEDTEGQGEVLALTDGPVMLEGAVSIKEAEDSDTEDSSEEPEIETESEPGAAYVELGPVTVDLPHPSPTRIREVRQIEGMLPESAEAEVQIASEGPVSTQLPAEAFRHEADGEEMAPIPKVELAWDEMEQDRREIDRPIRHQRLSTDELAFVDEAKHAKSQIRSAVSTEETRSTQQILPASELARTVQTVRWGLTASDPSKRPGEEPERMLLTGAFGLPAVSHPVVSALAVPHAFSRPAEHLCRQVTDAVLRMTKDRIEIALDPEELGSVRLLLSRTETGSSMTVWVERPEVLDLLRRNAEIMLADLRNSGLGETSLTFRDGPDERGADHLRRQQQGERDKETRVIGIAADSGRTGLAPRATGGARDGGRLDIRV